MEEYFDDYTGITPSILEDFAEIRNRFVNGGSASFKSFMALWKELKFEYLFVGIDDPKYGHYYGKDLLRAALSYTDSSNMPLVRIVGIYLCYAIYTSYPFADVIKTHIRITPEEWLALGDLVKDINDQILDGTALEKEMWHVVHVFNALRKKNAFCLAHTKMELFPQSHRLLNLEEDEIVNVSRPSAVSKIFNSLVLDELEATQKKYGHAKQEAALTNPGLNLLPEGDIVSKIKDVLGDHRATKRSSSDKKDSNGNDSEPETSLLPMTTSRLGIKWAPSKRKWRFEEQASPPPHPKRVHKDSTKQVGVSLEITNDSALEKNEEELSAIMDLF